MRHTLARLIIPLIVFGHLTAGAASPQTPALLKPAANNQLSPASLGFTVEYPKKDWLKPLMGVGSSILVLVHKSQDANVAIEKKKLTVALASSQITDVTATLEQESWQDRSPRASGFAYKFLDTPRGRAIVFDFVHPGEKGNDRVRLYALPLGTDLYRVICTARAAAFDKYVAVCDTVARTLTPTSP